MSDHEDMSINNMDTGFDTPVPELDDHRHQSAAVPRSRSRRGTVETMHSTTVRRNLTADLEKVNEGLLPISTRDFEHAVDDEDVGGISPAAGRYDPSRSRRGTVTTPDPRSVSPPNSVKAFADARRRERQLSTSDPNSVKAFAEARRHEDCELHRTVSGVSGTSKRSRRSRRYTNDNDCKSFASNKTAEEDVCFPLHPAGNKNTLSIDFEVLEDFIADEEEHDRSPPKGQPQAKIFHDLRSRPNNTFVTSNGDIHEIPSGKLSDITDKISEESLDEKLGEPQRLENRFEFFSSAGDSTIHAAEFGDLILPGEDVRGLFTPSQGEEEDGVWWLNMNNPTDEEIKAICKAFGVHPLTIEDIGTQEAREKIELFPSYYFACFRSFHVEVIDDVQQYEPVSIYVVVFREGTLSFSFSPNPHAAHVRERITRLKDYVSLSSDWICYALM